MPQLYPEIEPFATDLIKVSDLHTVYFEQCGNPNGKPVLFIHGGPGGGIDPLYRRFFDPAVYHIVLVDQRGCGKSTPLYELQENNTQNLINDFEKIRQQLNIDKWMLFGGSWGSTLALAYAQTHPQVVTELVLRGIFLASDFENQWLFGGQGANYIYPDLWEDFTSIIPQEERDDIIVAYYKRLTDEDPEVRKEAGTAWSRWETSISQLYFNKQRVESILADTTGQSLATLECHYMMNGCFLEPAQLIKNIDKIKHIPGAIVHGRYDVVCSASNAWRLHQQWPESQLYFIADAGHSLAEPGIIEKLVEITDAFKKVVV